MIESWVEVFTMRKKVRFCKAAVEVEAMDRSSCGRRLRRQARADLPNMALVSPRPSTSTDIRILMI